MHRVDPTLRSGAGGFASQPCSAPPVAKRRGPWCPARGATYPAAKASSSHAAPHHQHLARMQVLSSATPSASTSVTSTASSSVRVPAVAPSRPAPYQLPAHWQRQMQAAPMGKKRVLQRYYERLSRINDMEPALAQLSDEELQAKTDEFRQRLEYGGYSEDELLEEAFAVVREASKRVLGMRHFDSQMVGGMVLHEGQVAEMATGEGKTLVATLPCYLNALRRSSGGVHVITVNDYLSARDSEWMGKLYSFLGLSCRAVQSGMAVEQYKFAFSADIVYVTGQELGFTYLRDNTAQLEQELALTRRLNFALVDEADSVLIDEGRNPMIISLSLSQNEKVVRMVDKAVRALLEVVQDTMKNWDRALERGVHGDFEQAHREAEKRVKKQYFSVDEKTRSVSLTLEGLRFVFEELRRMGALFSQALAEGRAPVITDMWEGEVPWGHLAGVSLRAYELWHEGKHYIVQDGTVVIIDESTGRLKHSSRWQDGLHQAIEAKEGVKIKPESRPTAQITFQVFFRFYRKLAGMTGTAMPAAAEFFELYSLKVVQVPTNRPSLRQDRPPILFFNVPAKNRYLCNLVHKCWGRERPVLIGTTSVKESETIMALLSQFTPPMYRHHLAAVQLLNATPEKVRIESEIIAQAGLPGAVTISTNMAGRGTDIILGGNPKGLTRLVLMRLVYRRLLADESEAAAVPDVPYAVRDFFHTYDTRSKLNAYPVAADFERLPAEQRLPRDLHSSLLGCVMLAVSRRLSAQGSSARTPLLPFEQVSGMADWVMDEAYRMRKKVLRIVRQRYHTERLEELEYSVCLAPIANEVSQAEEEEREGPAPPQAQWWTAKAALLLWLWLDQQCARYAEGIRAAGGLLVIGTSVHESMRVQLQLAGRAGRQGDPGETLMVYDVADPLIQLYGDLYAISNDLMSNLGDDGDVSLQMPLVESLVSMVRRTQENINQTSRLEAKQYDEVVETYRSSMYALRRLILQGSNQQRTQIIYLFIQVWADRLVSELLDCQRGPEAWAAPTLEPEHAPGSARAGGEGLVSPLELLLTRAYRLLNPKDSTGPQVEYKEVKDGKVRDVTMQQLLSAFNLSKRGPEAGPGPQGNASGAGLGQATGVANVGMQLDELPLMTPQQTRDLVAFAGGASTDLPWPQPTFRPTVKQALAMETHIAIFGMAGPTDGQGSNGAALAAAAFAAGDAGASSSSAAAAWEQLVQRPELKGRYADKLSTIRNFLGLVLVQAFELRRITLQRMIMHHQSAMDLDAEAQVYDEERKNLLMWIDALWSSFLEDLDRIRKAVALRSGAQQPLSEFQMEANRSFLAVLDSYREAVVERVMAPPFYMSVPVVSMSPEGDQPPNGGR